MEACFENDVEVIVLDRPNPLGGKLVDGPGLDREWRSYVGAFHVPYVHGLTIGELARIARYTEGTMEVPKAVRDRGRLTIVPMLGWSRDMRWPETGLKWIPTSPYIPDLSAVLGYAMTGLGAQLGNFSHGIGTAYPFRFLRYKGLSTFELKSALDRKRISGLRFRPMKTKTTAGAEINGLYIEITDWEALRPTALSFHMMQITAELESVETFTLAKNTNLFNKHVGSTKWWKALTTYGEKVATNAYLTDWKRDAEAFRQWSQRFWIYQ